METAPVNIISLSRKAFNAQKSKPDNYLFFVYDEKVGADGQPKIKVSLYKGKHLICGDVDLSSINEKIDEISGCKIKSVIEDKNIIEPKINEIRNGNNVEYEITLPKRIVKAGTVSVLAANADPSIDITDNGAEQIINIGVPAAPYIKVTEVTPTITDNNYGIGNLGYASQTDYLDDGWLDDPMIYAKKQIVKNNRNYPCFVFVRTFPSNGDTANYSSSDCELLLPPQGKGVISHTKTYPGNNVGRSEVYPSMVTKPKIVYEVLFNENTQSEIYDNINSVKTIIDGSYSASSGGLTPNGPITITLPPTEIYKRPGTAYDGNTNKLDKILFENAFHFLIHFIGSSAKFVETKMTCLGSVDVEYRNLRKKILVGSPFHFYSTDNLDFFNWSDLNLFQTGLSHWFYHAIKSFTFTTSSPIKGIRIIAGTPADFLRASEFLTYKFD